jgi:hypothetical protein
MSDDKQKAALIAKIDAFVRESIPPLAQEVEALGLVVGAGCHAQDDEVEELRDQNGALIDAAYEAVEAYFSDLASDRSVDHAMKELRELLRAHGVYLYGERPPRTKSTRRKAKVTL